VAEGGFITQQAREIKGLEKTKLMAADGVFTPDFIKAAGEGVTGMYLSSPDVSAFAGGYKDFLAEHVAKYGENPVSIFHAHAYDAANVLMAAIQKVAVKDADGTLHIPRQALRDAVAATKDFKGLTGNLTCDPNGDCADPKIAVYEIIGSDATKWPDGVVKKIWPAAASSAGAAAAAVPTEPKKADAAPEDKLGVVAIKKGDPIVMGYGLVTTGANASLGTDSKRGVEIAIDDAKAVLFGHPIQLVGEDTGCSPEGGQAAASKLASNTAIVGIIGTSCSSEARVLAPVVSKAGMVIISPSNTAPDLTLPDKRAAGYFRTAHNDKVQGRAAAQFAIDQGIKKAATIHDGSLYAEQLANVFADNFKKLGGEIVAQEAVNVGDTDMSPVLTRLASLSPELIYYPIFVAEGGFITQQAREIKGLEKTKLMAADGVFTPDFIKAAGEGVTGMYLSSPDVSAFAGGYKDFLAEHVAKYGENPVSIFHAHAYDAANILMTAIKMVAVEGPDGTLYIPRQALRDAVAATKDFKGLTGSLTCDPNGDCADPKIAVYEIIGSDATKWPDGVVKKIWP
jgi:branched-chain amino acid transport system substrate-binding protein